MYSCALRIHRFGGVPTSLLCVLVVSFISDSGYSGDLNPPPGPITPTHHTPISDATTPGNASAAFRISQPGAYYLRGDVTGVGGKHGIVVGASDVTIDLSGFSVIGAAGSFDGISTDPLGQANVLIRNGTVRNWGNEGIGMTGSSGCLIEQVRAQDNGGDGIQVGVESTVRNCLASGNGDEGIAASTGCTIAHCTVTLNTGDGIFANNGSTVIGCTASDCGDDGIEAGSGVTIQDCTAYSNDDVGIVAVNGCTLVSCTGRQNGEGAATTNKHGFDLGAGNTLINCTANLNQGDGINATDGNKLSGCAASSNAGDGIEVSDDNIVLANACDSNGTTDGAGIHVTGSDNRIEGNNVTDNDRGLDVDLGGNFIIRNSAASNTTNYDIAASNVGFYVNGSITVAVMGSAGGTTIGTTDPWANISY